MKFKMKENMEIPQGEKKVIQPFSPKRLEFLPGTQLWGGFSNAFGSQL